jgi:hypothetical protein
MTVYTRCSGCRCGIASRQPALAQSNRIFGGLAATQPLGGRILKDWSSAEEALLRSPLRLRPMIRSARNLGSIAAVAAACAFQVIQQATLLVAAGNCPRKEWQGATRNRGAFPSACPSIEVSLCRLNARPMLEAAADASIVKDKEPEAASSRPPATGPLAAAFSLGEADTRYGLRPLHRSKTRRPRVSPVEKDAGDGAMPSFITSVRATMST